MTSSERDDLQPGDFLDAARLIIVAGKGGVGKTTVSATLARAAALGHAESLLIEIEGKTALPAAFGVEAFTYDEVVLHPGGATAAPVRARHITPDDALVEYLADHGLRRILKRLVASGALDVVATAVPGIRDILVLGKVKQLERSGVADLLVLDAPAAGHAFSFLYSARGLVDAVKVGPIHSQAADVLAMLTDPTRCQVVLVTLAEETPVNEIIETATKLRDRVGVTLGPVVVNGLYPTLDGLDADPVAAAAEAEVSLRPGEAERLVEAARFRARRRALQAEQVERLGEALDLPQIHLPYLFAGGIGPDEVDTLAHTVLGAIGRAPGLAGTTADARGGTPVPDPEAEAP